VFIVIRSFLDLREMKAGTRERAGENKTALASWIALAGILIALVAWIVWGILMCFAYMITHDPLDWRGVR
jgi:hypothetical protein